MTKKLVMQAVASIFAGVSVSLAIIPWMALTQYDSSLGTLWNEYVGMWGIALALGIVGFVFEMLSSRRLAVCIACAVALFVCLISVPFSLLAGFGMGAL